MEDVQMHLTIMPYKLLIASVRMDKIETVSHRLIKQIFYLEKSTQFISIARTEDEISLILEEDTHKSLTEGGLNIESSGIVWRAIQVNEGSQGFNPTGVVHALSEPLFHAGISIFYLSTNENDFVLVPDNRVLEALECLEKSVGVITEGLEELKAELSPQEAVPANKIKFTTVKRHPLASPLINMKSLALKRDELEQFGVQLIKLLFYTDYFCSYTEIDDEISILMDERALKEYNWPVQEGIWKIIRVADGPLGFDECGIVYSISDPMSRSKVNLFYISAFSTDYLFVSEVDTKRAYEALISARFEINITSNPKSK